ncbi:hypothetical protein BaRGS_00004170 [Batillaria attramentaria]|uniref:Uncharacterized protein n=1 Tax=Batillaria attramentaria TaxID=370345 RepID=A0ABD0M075_9CAEN
MSCCSLRRCGSLRYPMQNPSFLQVPNLQPKPRTLEFRSTTGALLQTGTRTKKQTSSPSPEHWNLEALPVLYYKLVPGRRNKPPAQAQNTGI